MHCPSFHLSLNVKSLDESTDFFTGILGGSVSYRDASGYVNIDLFGVQLTLNESEAPVEHPAGMHIGVNVTLTEFENIAEKARSDQRVEVVGEAHTVGAETPIERKKMYLRCPSGYLVEVKGYRTT